MKEADFEAPDVEVLLSDSIKARLSSFWQDRPVALVFMRHFG
jgi:hypothetical protein